MTVEGWFESVEIVLPLEQLCALLEFGPGKSSWVGPAVSSVSPGDSGRASSCHHRLSGSHGPGDTYIPSTRPRHCLFSGV